MDIAWTEVILSFGVGLGLAAAAGLRVFVPLLVLAASARLGWVSLTPGFEWLASGQGLAVLGTATVFEVAGYFVPWLDSLLDFVAGPLAVMAGVVAVAAVTGDMPAVVRWSLAIVAGGAAGLIQAATSLTRLTSTAATGGAANSIVAVVELAGSLVASVVAIVLPVLALVVVVGLVLLIRRVGRQAFGKSDASPSEEEQPC